MELFAVSVVKSKHAKKGFASTPVPQIAKEKTAALTGVTEPVESAKVAVSVTRASARKSVYPTARTRNADQMVVEEVVGPARVFLSVTAVSASTSHVSLSVTERRVAQMVVEAVAEHVKTARFAR